ncbi:hypothetical protein [Mycobacterium sp. GA-1841]|nr:hypothetical protein [Mycobacterium sp. GA-1841]
MTSIDHDPLPGSRNSAAWRRAQIDNGRWQFEIQLTASDDP